MIDETCFNFTHNGNCKRTKPRNFKITDHTKGQCQITKPQVKKNLHWGKSNKLTPIVYKISVA